MARSLHPKADYNKLCVDCMHRDDEKTIVPMCTVSRELVSGKQLRVPCADQRAVKGACGPEGKRWECEPSPAISNGNGKHAPARKLVAVS